MKVSYFETGRDGSPLICPASGQCCPLRTPKPARKPFVVRPSEAIVFNCVSSLSAPLFTAHPRPR